MQPPLLEVRDLHVDLGNVTVLRGVSLRVHTGEILGLIGPNGAGKSSLLNCINGIYPVRSGEILFRGVPITRLPAHARAALGIGRTFQGIQAYASMTVLENILAGRHVRLRTGILHALLHWPWVHREELQAREVAEEIIDLLELEPYRHKTVGSLGFGIRKRVDLGRALALEPSLLLLDEPTAGMSIEEKQDMVRFILDIRHERGSAIIIVEHDMEIVMDICDRVVVLDWGRVIAEGTPDEVRHHEAVIRAYLGVA